MQNVNIDDTKNRIIKSDSKDSSNKIEKHLETVIDAFNKKLKKFASTLGYHYHSDEVLKIIGKIDGYKIEKSKLENDLIKLLDYEKEKYYDKYSKLFCVDAINEKDKTILEIEAGRAYDNNQFLKDFFEAYVSSKIDYLIIAVRKIYGINNRKDYEYVNRYFDVLYHSKYKQNVPLKGILIIGY